MRQEPIIPKLRCGKWDYHSAQEENGDNNGSIISIEGGSTYCIAKQPRYVDDGQWETHAKAISAVPNMLKYLIEEWYSLGEKMVECDKILERSPLSEMGGRYRVDKRRDEYRVKYDEVEKILKEAGAFDEDIW